MVPTVDYRIAYPKGGCDSVAELAVGLYPTPPNFITDYQSDECRQRSLSPMLCISRDCG